MTVITLTSVSPRIEIHDKHISYTTINDEPFDILTVRNDAYDQDHNYQ